MRVQFPKGRQQAFLQTVRQITGVPPEHLAAQIGVCSRTFRDWQREKWNMTEEALQQLCRLANLPVPEEITRLQEHWSVQKAARIGGLRHLALYGPPGTPEGRRRGGQAAQRQFRLRPEWYRARRVAARKSINAPDYSESLAEFIGILLGDGGVASYQVKVSFNRSGEAEYLEFVKHLIERLFSVTASRAYDGEDGAMDLVVSSVELVEWLQRVGVKKGNKIAQQVDVPNWIWQRETYQRSCLRGLMDADGCFYRHRYRVNGRYYSDPKMCFVSYSKPLFESARRLFAVFGFAPTPHRDGRRLYLHDTAAVLRYMTVIGTHNSHHQRRFDGSSKPIGRESLERWQSGRLQLTANELGGQKAPSRVQIPASPFLIA